MQCPNCQGHGEVTRPIVLYDEEGNQYVQWYAVTCSACGGDGEV